MSMQAALRKTVLALLVASTCLAGPAMAHQIRPPPISTMPVGKPRLVRPAGLGQFDAYVNRVRKAFDVPGIAVAIVKDGHVVLEKGYGVRNRENGKPVDAHTIFAIASNTKAFTAAALSILAGAGKLKMDGRVIQYLPWFRMSNPYVTHAMRVRDLLAHHSGLSLGEGDLLYWPPTDYTSKQVVQRLAHLPLRHGFRAHYFYDNILFDVAALVVQNVSGESFRKFLVTHIFDPLGMHDTRFNVTWIRPTDHDVAIGYVKKNPETVALKPAIKLSWSNSPGAGGIYSSAHDMAKWIICQLKGGVYGKKADGSPKRLFSATRHKEMWSVQTAIHPRPSKIPALAAIAPAYEGYGEGWHLSQYRHHKMVYHTGGWPGFVSRVTMIPDLHLGMVVLTNAQSGAAVQAITWRILDAYMGAPKTDWIAVYTKVDAHRDTSAKKSWEKHVAARDKNVGPSLPLADYAGVYHDPWYGDVDITDQHGKLAMQFAHTKLLVGDMTHWSRDTFIVHWRDRSLNADAFVTFALTPDGKVRNVRMQPVSPLTDFSFDFQDLHLTPVTGAQNHK